MASEPRRRRRRQHREVVMESAHIYIIHSGGVLDAENTRTPVVLGVDLAVDFALQC
eukprot:SAG31_NODE_4462_length_3213_cov_3.051381_3_plen_56_part_00